jgi:putative spermidine/putrescine transport system ATP-binding protein
MPTAPTAAVVLQDVRCHFGSVRAVDGVNLAIAPGEFFTLLGPSGSGKTTCLRMIGGFVLPTAGRVLIGGQDMTMRPPYARPVNTVFQDYALFPHMNVRDNVAYSLMLRKVPRRAREQRADELLALVRLPGVGQRRPAELSGGQRQRVSLARALINEPQLLLLDEPLGALDLKLREQMQTELKALQRRLGITFLFITHDQHEALSMSDRIGVFNEGRLEQVGTPHEVYNAPATRFVAQFVGAANVLDGSVAQALTGASAAMLRPERIVLGDAAGSQASGLVSEVQYFGAFTRVRVECMETVQIQVDLPTHGDVRAPETGTRVHLHWDARAVHVLLPLPPGDREVPLVDRGEGRGGGAASANHHHPLTPTLSPVSGGEGVKLAP